MNQDQVIVFDLEWNGGWGGVKLNEILQIGAVKLDGFGGSVLDTFLAFVKPTVHKTLNQAAKALAIPAEELDGGEPFAVALERFLNWCGENCVFASWGPHDLKELRDNAAFWKLDVQLPKAVCDLQAAAGNMAGAKGSIALSAMAEYFGLPDSLDFHNALNDAFYAAMIGRTVVAMGGDSVIRKCCRSSVFDKYTRSAFMPQELYPYVVYTGHRRGGFAEEQAVLNNRNIRRQACPECGRPLYVTRWYPLGERSYLTRSTCPDHGRQYFWATLSRSETGTWRGKVHTLESGPDIQSLFSGCDKASAIPCKRSKHRKRRLKHKQTLCEDPMLTA